MLRIDDIHAFGVILRVAFLYYESKNPSRKAWIFSLYIENHAIVAWFYVG